MKRFNDYLLRVYRTVRDETTNVDMFFEKGNQRTVTLIIDKFSIEQIAVVLLLTIRLRSYFRTKEMIINHHKIENINENSIILHNLDSTSLNSS